MFLRPTFAFFRSLVFLGSVGQTPFGFGWCDFRFLMGFLLAFWVLIGFFDGFLMGWYFCWFFAVFLVVFDGVWIVISSGVCPEHPA